MRLIVRDRVGLEQLKEQSKTTSKNTPINSPRAFSEKTLVSMFRSYLAQRMRNFSKKLSKECKNMKSNKFGTLCSTARMRQHFTGDSTHIHPCFKQATSWTLIGLPKAIMKSGFKNLKKESTRIVSYWIIRLNKRSNYSRKSSTLLMHRRTTLPILWTKRSKRLFSNLKFNRILNWDKN